jgi:membrane-associated phospholipid phosphatase
VLGSPAVLALDRAVDRVAARARGHAVADRALYALSEAANHSLLWHGINALDALLGGRDRRRRALRRSVVLVAEQAVVNGPIKRVFRRERPDHVTDHPHDLRTPLTSSFPSGHASAGACAATMLTADLGGGPLWWGLAAAVAWSRVHVGAHHASDLVGGAAAGAVLARLAGVLWPPGGRNA